MTDKKDVVKEKQHKAPKHEVAEESAPAAIESPRVIFKPDGGEFQIHTLNSGPASELQFEPPVPVGSIVVKNGEKFRVHEKKLEGPLA